MIQRLKTSYAAAILITTLSAIPAPARIDGLLSARLLVL